MKIAQIAPPWIAIPPKNYGGTENVIYNLVQEQVAQGHDVTLFASGDTQTSAKLVSFFPKALIEEGTPWTMHLKAFYYLYKAIEQVKEQSFDIVHTHLSSSSDMYLFPLTAHLTTPHVTTLHSHFPFDRDPRSNWVGDADKLYMEFAPLVPIVAISDSARRQEKLPLNFVGVVCNGLSEESFAPSRRPRENFLFWLGRIEPDKGAHLAIEAAEQTHIPLILAGIVDRHSKTSPDYFRDQIKPHLDSNLIRYIGPVNMKQKLSLFSRARCFLNPIQWEEPFGMVMIEAMAQGCPVISFDRGAAPEIIADRESGFLVQNLDEMVQSITRIQEIDCDAVRAYTARHFSARVMAEQYMQIYEKVIAMNPAMTPRSSTPTLERTLLPGQNLATKLT